MGEQPTAEQLSREGPVPSLEAFIRLHRDGFEEPWDSEAGWQAFCRSMPSERKQRPAPIRMLRTVRRLAAASLVILSLAAFARAYQVSKQDASTLPADLQRAQAYYEGEIHRTVLDIQRHQDSLHPVPENVLNTVEQHGSEYRLLLQGLEENPGDEQVHAAFVEYYRSRLSLLEQLRSKRASVRPFNP